MQRKLKIVTFAAIVAMLSPAATATWMSYGTFEPDTVHDESGMFGDPPALGEKKLYFNAITTNAAGATNAIAMSPNVGALQTQNEVASSEFHFAILGVWTDCNGDGYVGMAETALREYASQLLLDTSVCSPEIGLPNSWSGANNYNGWVSEFIPVVPFAPASDKRVYVDSQARVWGDFGVPDEQIKQRSCTLAPQARGTYQSTGGAINWIDCRVDIIGASNQATAAADPTNSLGLRYGDIDDARQANHPLHAQTFGAENSSNSAVYYADCSGDPTFRLNSTETVDGTDVEETAGQSINTLNGNEFVVPALDPRAGSATPTVAGTMNTTREEADWFVFASGDCDYTNDNGGDTYELECQVSPVAPCVGEADFNGVNPQRKDAANWNFGYANATRGGTAVSLTHGGTAGAESGNAGVTPARPGGGVWQSTSVWLSKPGFSVVKADLSSGGVGLAEAYYLTFYARVGEATTSAGIETPTSGVYGTCGSETTGNILGFMCDPGVWNRNPDGSPIPDPTSRLSRVGWHYDARDVDCYDGGNSLGVGVQPASLGAAPCA